MKKIVFGFLTVLIFSMTLFNIRCQEVFLRINALDSVGIISQKEELETPVAETEKKEDKEVRIVIMNNNYSSIYHSDISFSSDTLAVYYGTKYSNKKLCKKIDIKKDGKLFKEGSVVKVESKSPIKWKGHNENNGSPAYKGMFYVYSTKNGLVAVNQLNMEDYVAGVISSEIGEECPIEALKAQAICARTFIENSNTKKYKKYKADGDDSTSYQVYNRLAPGKNCEKAANATKNMVMTYKGKLIRAYYFSTSCGYTTNYKIWGKKKLGYLCGCRISEQSESLNLKNNNEFKKFITSTPNSFESQYPFYRWNVFLSNMQMESSIKRAINVDVGEIKKIEINSRGDGGIVSKVSVYGKNGKIVMKNQNQIRKAFSPYYSKVNLNDGSTRTGMEMLPSAFIYLENIYESGKVCGFQIYGGGFGHGSGMSQNAAEEMAEKGMNYEQILTFFYKDIIIEKR